MKKLMILMFLLMVMLPIRADATAQSDERLISMGEFRLTYYCSCEECSGHYGTRTATGTTCEQGRTVAVDPDVIAYGTRILIDDNVYIAEDCGSRVVGDHIDIYVEDHDLVEKLGKKVKKIWLIK